MEKKRNKKIKILLVKDNSGDANLSWVMFSEIQERIVILNWIKQSSITLLRFNGNK